MTAPYNPSAAGSFIEGLTGGFQSGYGLRTSMQDRKRRLSQEDEEAVEARARRLREQVGFELTQKVQNAALERAGLERAEAERVTTERTARQGAVRASAARIREQYGKDQRYRPIMLLPDEELVQRFGEVAERAPAEARERQAMTRQDLTTLNAQIDDARGELSRAERERPERPEILFDEGAARQFSADSAAAEARVMPLRRYVGNLLVSRDSTAAEARGQRVDPRQMSELRGVYGVESEEASAVDAGMQSELRSLAERIQRILRNPLANEEDKAMARAELERRRAEIVRRYGVR